MKQVYAAMILATKPDNISGTDISYSPTILYTESEAEALGLAYNLSLKSFTRTEGYSHHIGHVLLVEDALKRWGYRTPKDTNKWRKRRRRNNVGTARFAQQVEPSK